MEDGLSGGAATPSPPAVRRPTPRTHEARKTIAHQIVMGMSYSEIAALHKLDPSQVHNMARAQDMQQLIQEQRTYLMESSSRIMFKFLMHADQLADDQIADASNRGSPNNYKARTWILDRVSPQRHVSQQQVDINHNITHEVMLGLADAIKEVGQVLPGSKGNGKTDGIALLDGKTALPPVDYDLEDAE